ncbi:hypothetical protein ACH5RR_037374, partial [Cinchona calisaya]
EVTISGKFKEGHRKPWAAAINVAVGLPQLLATACCCCCSTRGCGGGDVELMAGGSVGVGQ